MKGPLVAVVTGARVGIGQATAVALGEAGLRVALTSRSDPGSALEEVESAGGKPLAVALDLLDRASVDRAVEAVMSEWGRIDILVNNALCDQPGSQAPIDETDYDAFERMIVGEVVNTTYLTRQVLRGQEDRTVTVINIGSAAADYVPPAPIGQGGYAYSYAANKAALHRLAGFLQLEYGGRVRAFTVNPGVVRTERLLERLGDLPGSVDPSVPGRVVRWLALDPESDAWLGQYLHAQKVAKDKGWL